MSAVIFSVLKYEINLKSDILKEFHVIIKQETKAGTWYPLSLYQITFQEKSDR